MTKPDKTLDQQIDEILYGHKDSWKFCSTKIDDLSLKFKTIVLDELGNHPIGDYVYLDDCACMLSLEPIDGCGCDCHKIINDLNKSIQSLIADESRRAVEYDRAVTITKPTL